MVHSFKYAFRLSGSCDGILFRQQFSLGFFPLFFSLFFLLFISHRSWKRENFLIKVLVKKAATKKSKTEWIFVENIHLKNETRTLNNVYFASFCFGWTSGEWRFSRKFIEFTRTIKNQSNAFEFQNNGRIGARFFRGSFVFFSSLYAVFCCFCFALSFVSKQRIIALAERLCGSKKMWKNRWRNGESSATAIAAAIGVCVCVFAIVCACLRLCVRECVAIATETYTTRTGAHLISGRRVSVIKYCDYVRVFLASSKL